ncbi:MAG: aminotransferase class V-fold PLP-dependent enzyme [Clostridiales bacterium]|jgi:cysteine desulfurase|nr:aminotransferase class V-fold PLP-dependent enzyme [Clostridiales bacterium]
MIYLDNAATTRVYPELNETINYYNTERFFNGSALYAEAAAVSRDLKNARENLLRHLGGDGGLIFTASGTEADNMAFFCKTFKPKSRIIISDIEHAAVLNTAAAFKQKGFDVVSCHVDGGGRAVFERFQELLTPETAFVSIVHVSNETGAVNDIEKIARAAKAANKDCIVHSDGVQAFKKIGVNVGKLGADLYSVSAHKIHAPKGVGALYFKKGMNLNTFIYGGGQEMNIRSATENLAGIAAFSKAADIADGRGIDRGLLPRLKDFLTDNFDVMINTPEEDISGILSVSFAWIRSETLLHSLEKHGVIVGTGSACSSKKGVGRIAEALRLPKKYYEGILRISISGDTTEDEIEFFKEKLLEEHAKLFKRQKGN